MKTDEQAKIEDLESYQKRVHEAVDAFRDLLQDPNCTADLQEGIRAAIKCARSTVARLADIITDARCTAVALLIVLAGCTVQVVDKRVTREELAQAFGQRDQAMAVLNDRLAVVEGKKKESKK